MHELRRIAEAVRAAVEDVPGVVDLAVEQQADVPQLRIAANRDAMSKYGVTPGTIAEAIDVAFYGERVSQVLEGQKAFDLVVRFDEEHRGSAEKIRHAVIDTPLGARVELGWLAEITQDRGPNAVSREKRSEKDRGPIECERP